MSEILYKLLFILNQKPEGSTFYSIAMTLLLNIDHLESFSIETISRLCNVSNSSVSRFCRKIGYEDFFDFKYCLLHDVSNDLYRSELNSRLLDNSMDFSEYRQLYMNEISRCYSAVLDNINLDEVDRLARDIMTYQKVIAMGLLHSEYACLTLQAKMIKLGKIIITLIDTDAQYDYLRNSSDENSLILIFSITGNYLHNTLFKAKNKKSHIKDTKAKVVLLTNNKDFEYPDLVDEIIYMGGDLSKNGLKFINNHTLLAFVDLLVYRYGKIISEIK
jgi:DNA-binding MurR/RpiR family transcriptional regulator